MGYIYLFVTILMAFGSWWAGSKAWEEFSTGDITGVVTLQDGVAPERIRIQLRFKDELIAEKPPGHDGSYKISVKTGAYSISFQSDGYRREILPISIQSGVTPVPNVVLNIIPKVVEICLVDKQDRPYSNIDMQLSRIGQIGTMNTPVAKLHFDQFGKSKTPQIEFGEYALVLMSPIDDERKFLWVDGKSQNSFPGFLLKSDTDIYKILLPRVLHAEHSGPNSAPTYSPVKDHFFAQSFIVHRDLLICGVGFGLGIGGNGVPTSLQIRDDSSRGPASNVILEVKPNRFSASMSNVRAGSFGDSCKNKSSTILKPGTYWIVAKYDSLPERISLLGGPGTSSGGQSLKKSIDGVSWTDFSFNNIKMLDLFLTE